MKKERKSRCKGCALGLLCLRLRQEWRLGEEMRLDIFFCPKCNKFKAVAQWDISVEISEEVAMCDRVYCMPFRYHCPECARSKA